MTTEQKQEHLAFFNKILHPDYVVEKKREIETPLERIEERLDVQTKSGKLTSENILNSALEETEQDNEDTN